MENDFFINNTWCLMLLQQQKEYEMIIRRFHSSRLKKLVHDMYLWSLK